MFRPGIECRFQNLDGQGSQRHRTTAGLHLSLPRQALASKPLCQCGAGFPEGWEILVPGVQIREARINNKQKSFGISLT